MKKSLFRALSLAAILGLVFLQPVLAAPQSTPCDARSGEDARAALLQADPLGLTPAAEPRVGGCQVFCQDSGALTTATTYATGSSCSVALTNLTTLLRSLADTTCGFTAGACHLNVIQTVPCQQVSPGVYRIDGYATHGCRESTC